MCDVFYSENILSQLLSLHPFCMFYCLFDIVSSSAHSFTSYNALSDWEPADGSASGGVHLLRNFEHKCWVSEQKCSVTESNCWEIETKCWNRMRANVKQF